MTNQEKLYDALASTFQVPAETIDDRASPDSIASWDSLAVVNLVAELEAAFGVEFDILEIADFHNVGIIKSILEGKGIAF